MDVDFIKRYIVFLAYHKMNILHWHLTEDQGWRIEIEKYPKLTDIGAWRKEKMVLYMEVFILKSNKRNCSICFSERYYSCS